jgi:hypothetical protein
MVEVENSNFGEASVHTTLISRLLKNDFSTTFSCENPNDFDGCFSKTWLFQHPVRANLVRQNYGAIKEIQTIGCFQLNETYCFQ